MKKRKEEKTSGNLFSWNETIQKLVGEETRPSKPEFPSLIVGPTYTVSIEFRMNSIQPERSVDEAIADAIYNIGGAVINVSEYQKNLS